MQVLHIITGLQRGGVNVMYLCKFDTDTHTIISLSELKDSGASSK